MKKIVAMFALGFVLAMVVTSSAKGPESDVYIVIMAKDPAVAYEGGVETLKATKPGKGQKINPKSAHVRKYTEHLTKTHTDALAECGVDEGKQDPRLHLGPERLCGQTHGG